MIKIIKKDEIQKTLQIIQRNILDFPNMDNLPELLKYNGVLLTSSIEHQINSSYEKLGLDYKVRQSANVFKEIPYNKDIKLTNLKNKLNIKSKAMPKYYIHQADTIKVDKYFKPYIKMVAYDKPIQIPCIVENEEVWMSPTLREYNTMKESIDKATGNVLAFGLGCGFYPYLCLLKEEVKSVTILELNPRIITIFKEFILPQFPRAADIKIIKGNAFDYFNDEFLNQYDYTFVDIWKGSTDGLKVYKDLLKKSVSYSNIDYWIENEILIDISIHIAIYLINLYRGTLTEILNKKNNEFTCIYKAIHTTFRASNKEVTTEEDLLYYLHDKSFIQKVITNIN